MYKLKISDEDESRFQQSSLQLQERVYVGYLKGIKFLSEGNFEIAIGCFSTSIGLLNLGWLYRLRAMAFLGHKKYHKAISDCEIFIKKYPKAADGYIVRGQAYMMMQDYKTANTKFEEALSVVDPPSDVLEQLAALCKDSPKKDEKFEQKFFELNVRHQQDVIDFEVERQISNKQNTQYNLQCQLSMSDIVALASSSDINARSMGALLLVEHIAEGNDKNKLTEMINCGGIKAISESLKMNDPELTFYATKAVSDLSWIPNLELRWEMVNAGVIESLVKQLSSNDPDLIGVTVSALALLGRGGTGIDKTIMECGGIEKLVPLLLKCNAKDKNSGYIAQAFTWLSGDVENKEAIIQQKGAVEALYKLAKQTDNPIARQYAIVAIGNICQNPEIWGKSELYPTVSALVLQLVKQGLVNMLVDYVKPTVKTSEAVELQYNSLVTLTQLIGFKHVRAKLDRLGGEKIFHPMLTSEYAGLREIASKAVRFYRTLQDYGDRIGDILIPKFRCVQQGEIEPPNLLMKPHTETKKNTGTSSILESSANEKETFEAISHIMNGLFGVASVWDADNKKGGGNSKKQSPRKQSRKKQEPAQSTAKVEKSKKETSNEKPKNGSKKEIPIASKPQKPKDSKNVGNTKTTILTPQSEKDMYVIFLREFEKGMVQVATRLGWGIDDV